MIEDNKEAVLSADSYERVQYYVGATVALRDILNLDVLEETQ